LGTDGNGSFGVKALTTKAVHNDESDAKKQSEAVKERIAQ